jgi:hypothetical protein
MSILKVAEPLGRPTFDTLAVHLVATLLSRVLIVWAQAMGVGVVLELREFKGRVLLMKLLLFNKGLRLFVSLETLAHQLHHKA